MSCEAVFCLPGGTRVWPLELLAVWVLEESCPIPFWEYLRVFTPNMWVSRNCIVLIFSADISCKSMRLGCLYGEYYRMWVWLSRLCQGVDSVCPPSWSYTRVSSLKTGALGVSAVCLACRLRLVVKLWKKRKLLVNTLSNIC